MIQTIRLLFLAVFILGAFQATAQTESKVHITKTGAKYNRASARYVQTGWESTLSVAKERGLTACLVCKPGGESSSTPATSSSSEANSLRSTTPSTTKPAVTTSSSQCTATTKAKTRCSRKTAEGSIYCWQHGDLDEVTS